MPEIAFNGIDEGALAALACELAPRVRGGGSIHLAGPLGAGKTTFARALLRALGAGERVKSPTYTLIESYALSDLTAHHLDLYRIAAAEELEWLGLRDLADGPVLWLIEWPERGAGAIPEPDLTVNLAHAFSGRDVHLVARGEIGRRWLEGLGGELEPDSKQRLSHGS
ncbi:MAG TPA: tRNA (adenosine(37)-N6)-threonylcarbamoyltransferase complex ATPase subunit type 1 TsaE [Rudaea sp.]|nr:tRNA (adenosine(37)-N6)-threonylcarbamoyltransferase complex ATPase subunit type 1 TsaE [Rudaea sp.]